MLTWKTACKLHGGGYQFVESTIVNAVEEYSKHNQKKNEFSHSEKKLYHIVVEQENSKEIQYLNTNNERAFSSSDWFLFVKGNFKIGYIIM